MKAAVWYGRKDLRVMDVPEPTVKPGYVKIKIAWAGICGTDRHEYAVGPVFIPVKEPHRLTGRMAPLTLGHEFSGIVTEVGDGVKNVRVGDRITASGNIVCGECEFCKSGRINLCEKLGFNGISDDGAFAEYIRIPEYQAFKIPNNVTLEEAVVTEPLACGVHSTKLITNIVGSLKGKKVAIVGPGMIGISCLIGAKLAGAEEIMVIGNGNTKEALVKKLGASVYVDSKKVNAIEYAKEWTGNGFDVVYECVGLEATLKEAVNISKKGGIVMVMGVYEKEPSFSINLFQEGERILLTSQAYIDELSIVLDAMSKGIIRPLEIITKRITLDRIVEDGFEELLKNPDSHVKIAIKIADLE
jgi:(R,R)-butanediol dehydrogenase/meso-butanediol dehydrogenase/diacetyl reductase